MIFSLYLSIRIISINQREDDGKIKIKTPANVQGNSRTFQSTFITAAVPVCKINLCQNKINKLNVHCKKFNHSENS